MDFEKSYQTLADNISQELYTKSEYLDNDFLEEAVEYLLRTGNNQKYIDDFEYYLVLSTNLYEKIMEKDYLLLLPGSSPVLFWYCCTIMYPDLLLYDYIKFPISGIKKQQDPMKSKGQYNLVEHYLNSVIRQSSKDILIVDYVFKGDSFKVFKSILEKRGVNVESYNINRPMENFRCFPKNNLQTNSQTSLQNENSDSYTSSLQNENSLLDSQSKQSEFNYFHCNILLYVFNNWYFNEKQTIEIYKKIERKLENENIDIYVLNGQNVRVYAYQENKFQIVGGILKHQDLYSMIGDVLVRNAGIYKIEKII